MCSDLLGSAIPEGGVLVRSEIWDSRYLPGGVIVLRNPRDGATGDTVPLLDGETLIDGKAAAYVCRDSVCKKPVTVPGELDRLLARGHLETD